MRKNAGFSLIELLIVVAIILIIAAIAIPNMIKAKVAANEASAVASVRVVTSMQQVYASMYPTIGYADNLSNLGTAAGNPPPTPAKAGLVDWLLGCNAQPCPRSGYLFSINNPQVGANGAITNYELNGVPQTVGKTGARGFCAHADGAIMFDPNGGTACTEIVQ